MKKSGLLLGASLLALTAVDVGVAYAQIDEIVVVARKREESLQSVPVAVTAFSASEIRNLGITDVVDVQYSTPGIIIQPQGGSPAVATVTMRGQSQADILLTTDASVGVYVDGVSLPRQYGMTSNLFDLERIEVLKGPQGTLYGRNTTGGAINLIAKKADYDGISGFVEAATGSFSRRDFGGAINLPVIQDRLAVRVAGQSTKADGIAESSATGFDIRDDEETFGRVNVQIDPTDNLNISITGDYLTVNEGGSLERNLAVRPLSTDAFAAGVQTGLGIVGVQPVLDSFAIGGSAAGDFYDSNVGSPTNNKLEIWGIGGTITYDFGVAELKSITGYRELEDKRILDLDGTPFLFHETTFDVAAETFTQELQLQGEALDERLDWIVGGFYSSEKGNDNSFTRVVAAINPLQILFDAEVENKSWAIFAQGTYALTNRLDLTMGGRYTEEEKDLTSRNRRLIFATGGLVVCQVGMPPAGTCPAVVSPTGKFDGIGYHFALDYDLTEDWLTYFSVSRGFRGGGQNLRGLNSIPNSLDPFAPEFARTWEVGSKVDFWDNRARVNVAAYRTDYSDIQRSNIVVNPGPGGGNTTVLVNAASATIQGFEIEADLNPIDNLTFNASLGYVDAKYNSFTDLDAAGAVVDRTFEDFGVPEFTSSLTGRYEIPCDKWGTVTGLQLDWYWRSEQRLDPNVRQATAIDLQTQDAYSLINARLDVLHEPSGVSLAVFGKNLTKEEYLYDTVNLSNTLGHTVGIAGEPRIWGVEARVDF